MRVFTVSAAAAVLMVASVSCGGDDAGPPPGSPAQAADADRSVRVDALDSLKFDPGSLVAAPGETITFVVTNTGKADHEFLLGDAAAQKQRAGGGHHHGEHDAGVHLPPGATEEITWTMPPTGELIYACHVDGHYSAGMWGTIEIGR